MTASSADSGFFQKAPVLENHFHDDSYQRCFKLFLPDSVASATRDEVESLGQEVISDRIFRWVSDAERNVPFLKGSGRDAFGKWSGEIVTGEGWRQLQEFGIAKGFVATAYDTDHGPFSRPLQFLRLTLWEPSCANVTCPSAMQDGAARIMQLHLKSPALSSELSDEKRRVFENAFEHLTSRDPKTAWTSGQWMTERTGGSDVSQTETRAEYRPGSKGYASLSERIPLGPWSINGFKWFSSATDSSMTILLAKAPSGALSAFLAPMHKDVGDTSDSATSQVLNGVRISRLKDKVGTRSLPTAELILEDMRAWMVGKEGQGIHEILPILNITRLHSAVTAASYVGRGLSIARGYALVREVGEGKGRRSRLADNALHMNTLAKMTLQYRGMMMVSLFTSYVLGLSEHPQHSTPANKQPGALAAVTPSAKHVAALLRILTPVAKAYVCHESVPIMHSCMEALGGVGYLSNSEQEHLNISRLWRDCAVLPIWEGTTDVLCSDFIRGIKSAKGGEESLAALDDWIKTAFAFQSPAVRKRLPGLTPLQIWEEIKTQLLNGSRDELMRDARELVWGIAQLLILALLYVDAERDGDRVAGAILERFAEAKMGMDRVRKSEQKENLVTDFAIVYGERKPAGWLPPKL